MRTKAAKQKPKKRVLSPVQLEALKRARLAKLAKRTGVEVPPGPVTAVLPSTESPAGPGPQSDSADSGFFTNTGTGQASPSSNSSSGAGDRLERFDAIASGVPDQIGAGTDAAPVVAVPEKVAGSELVAVPAPGAVTAAQVEVVRNYVELASMFLPESDQLSSDELDEFSRVTAALVQKRWRAVLQDPEKYPKLAEYKEEIEWATVTGGIVLPRVLRRFSSSESTTKTDGEGMSGQSGNRERERVFSGQSLFRTSTDA